jgi:phosphoenolpyruvate carboxylase
VNVLAVFLLLKASGNVVAEKERTIDIVTLSESVKDLEEFI